MSPPTWQQMPRVAGTSRIFVSLAASRVTSVFRTNRAGRVAVVVPAVGGGGAGGGGSVEVLRPAGGVEGAGGLQDEPGEPVDAVEGGEVGRGGGLGGGARRGVQRGRVVQVDEAVAGEL